jgi:hypothetical protein
MVVNHNFEDVNTATTLGPRFSVLFMTWKVTGELAGYLPHKIADGGLINCGLRI